MRLSTQLTVSILGITILALAVFGSIAYWVIDDSHDRTYNDLLLYISHNIEKRWSQTEEKALTQSSLDEISRFINAPDIILLAEDTNGNKLITDNASLSASKFSSSLIDSIFKSDTSTHHEDSLHTQNRQGSFEIKDQSYHWVSIKYSNSPYRLTILKPSSAENHQTSSRLSTRLLVTGFVIFWIAFWLAVLLSSVISRKLKEKNDALEYLALHDELTGLPNRNLFFDRLKQAQSTSNRNKTSFALLIMDLDNFKEINDTLGHHFGDSILVETSKIIQLPLREVDSIARLGGDEFAILLPNTSHDGAITCANKILEQLRKPITIKNVDIENSASIGISFYPQDGYDAEILLQRADVAMYQAKQTRSRYVIYDPLQDTSNVRSLTLMNKLRNAIENNQISVFYQPMIDQKNNTIVAVEALARWEHAELGFIPPDEFIPMAERSGLIQKLTLSIIKQAVQDCQRWHKLGHKLTVAINISTHCLQDQSLPEKLASILQEHGVSAENIELEITETALMQDLGRARQVLEQLDQAGFNLSIDDFGTGFSSLAYLKELPVNTLKIDKSFVFNMNNSDDDAAIVQTIIELAHNFNCKVIAEGVENKYTLEKLKNYGNDVAQGYLFSRPIPFDAFNKWLKDSEWHPASTISVVKETSHNIK